jgi:hypothetical protein
MKPVAEKAGVVCSRSTTWSARAPRLAALCAPPSVILGFMRRIHAAADSLLGRMRNTGHWCVLRVGSSGQARG